MKLFLVGHPVAHSISPAIQNAALRASGLPECYGLLDTPPERLAETLATLRQADGDGCNVTVPHKRAVLPYLDELAPEAQKIGAVNTIANRDGRLVGFNTDASGFLASLHEAGVDVNGQQVVLLGAGGAARAIAMALAGAGVARLSILNRDAGRATALAETVRATLPAHAVTLASGQVEPCHVEGGPLERTALASKLAVAQLIVNATTVGMHGDESPLPTGLIPSKSTVCDIIYNPSETALLRQARAAGARAVNGLGMLVHQAAAAFSIWTGRPAPLPIMHQAARQALEQLRVRA